MLLESPASPPTPRSAIDLLGRLSAVVGRLFTALRKPEGEIPATRWLFARLALLSLAVTTPVLLLTARSPGAAVAVLLGSLVLGASWTIGYLRGGASVVADVVDTLAVVALGLAGEVPSGVFAVLVSALWLRSLDGTTVRAYLRPVAYTVALCAAVLVWPALGTQVDPDRGGHVLATVPILFLTVVVARRLAWTLADRRRRDAVAAVYATAVAQLIGVTDDAALRRVAASADHAFCDAVPGLRIAKVDVEGEHLVVQGLRGPWTARPDRLPAALVGSAVDEVASVEHVVTAADRLDAAAGDGCAWLALSLPVVPQLGVHSWLLVGAPGAVPGVVVWALKNLANHMALAYAVAEAHDVLMERATMDTLTGLANRTTFMAALEAALADDAPGEVSVLFVDMDDFKAINDRLGHHAGDQVLREVGTRLLRAARPGDVCARLGGDEFAVLLPGAGARAAAIAAQRVAAAVRAPLRRAGDVVVPLSASVGCATAPSGTDPEELLRHADSAMYEAKRKAS